MFVDVCFPKGNEKEFIEIALRIGTRGICFVYDDKPNLHNDARITLFCASRKSGRLILSDNLNLNQRGVIHFYLPKREQRKLNAPMREMTQVTMNSIKEHGGIIGISVHDLLRTNCFEEASFIARLAVKSSVPLYSASFAREPLEMIPEGHVRSIMGFISKDTGVQKRSVDILGEFLKGKTSM